MTEVIGLTSRVLRVHITLRQRLLGTKTFSIGLAANFRNRFMLWNSGRCECNWYANKEQNKEMHFLKVMQLKFVSYMSNKPKRQTGQGWLSLKILKLTMEIVNYKQSQ